MSYTERACAVALNLQSLLQRHSIKETGADIWRQRLRKCTLTAVHTKTHRQRFQIYPLWRAFSNLCVYGESFHRLRVDGRPRRIKTSAFTIVCVYNRLRVDGAVEVDLRLPVIRDLQIRLRLRVRVRLLSARGLGLSCRRHCCCRRPLATKIFQ